MSTLAFFMNNIACDPPENWQETEIEASFEDNSPVASVKINSFDFVGSNAVFINNWIASGLYGGAGLMEGIPFRIEACNGVVIFNGVLDLQAETNEFDCDRCTVALKQLGAIDWLTDVADSLSFAYLASSMSAVNNPSFVPISITDYVKVPYALNSIPQYLPAAMLAMTDLLIAKEIAWCTYELGVVGYELTGSGATAIATAGLSSPLVIAAILKFSLLLVYLVLLIATFVKMIKQLMDDLVQPDKYKYGMYVRDLFKKACQYLNLTFNSSILNDPTSPFYNLVIIPQKYTMGENPNLFNRDLPFDEGYSSFWGSYKYRPNAYGYYDGTFGDLIRAMNDVFNAKIRIIGNSLKFERFDSFPVQSFYTLPDIVEEPHMTNASELASNYYVSFATDDDDLNTFNIYDGTNAQCIFVPNVIQNSQNNVLLKNLVQKNLIFALAKRKEKYTLVEDAMIGITTAFSLLYGVIFSGVDGVINIMNGVTSLLGINLNISNPLPGPSTFVFGQRIGFMLLETDFIGTQKMLIIEPSNSTVSTNNSVYLTAIYLLQNFHNHSFILDSATGIDNQYYKLKNKEIPFCCKDYLNILNSNFIHTFTGNIAKTQKLLWSPEKDEARIDYDPKVKWTNNIKQQYVVDGVNI